MLEGTYWSRRAVGRRTLLRGAGLAAAGMAGAALLGCGSGDEASTVASTSPGGAGAAPAGKVSADQVRVKPAFYEGFPAATPAELAPLANGRYGGTVVHRLLDPPHMDFNRVLSCTVNTTMDYTNNKLTAAKFGPTSNGNIIEIEPDLAEKWEGTPDSTQFTFHLRKGVKFQNVSPTNGRELTIEDVKLSFERYRKGGTQQDVFSEVGSFETPDDYTLVVKLTQPLVDFPRNIAAWSFIMAKELIADPELLSNKAVGTGPFIQQEWTRKEREVLVRNPDYFEKGLPFLDKVIGVVQNDSAALRAGYMTDNFFDWAARDEEDAKDMQNRAKDSVRYLYEGVQGANSNVFRFQMKNPVLQDPRIRRAISMSIDRKGYNDTRGETNGGFSKPSISWQALFNTRPTLEQEGPYYQYNPAEASRMLQGAGYSAQNPLTFEMTAWYLSNLYQFNSVILPMMNALPELEIKYREVDNPTAVSLLNDRSFPWATGMTFGPPAYSVDQAVYPFYHSKGGVNFGNLSDPEMDRLVEIQRREQNPEAQKETWKKIWDRELDIVYDVFLPLGPTTGGSFFHNYVINWRAHGIGSATCYANRQLKSVWLDAGAPATAVLDDSAGGLL
jgi:peptide/nickel transport system substrate-binding protein